MKFLHEFFNKDTGVTVITLSDKYNVYTGEAKTHPDDKPYMNEFVGCRLAEKRAWLIFYKEELKRQTIKLQAIENLNNDIKHNVKGPIDPKIQRRINLKLRDYNNNIIELKNTIHDIKFNIKKDIELRDSLIDKRRTKEDKE